MTYGIADHNGYIMIQTMFLQHAASIVAMLNHVGPITYHIVNLHTGKKVA